MDEALPGLENVAADLHSWLEALRLALGAESASLWKLAAAGDELSVALCTPPGADTSATSVPLLGHALGWAISEGVSLRASRKDIFRDAAEGWVVAAPVTDPRGERVGCVALEFAGVPRSDAPRALELAAAVAGRLLGGARAAERALADLKKYEALYGAIHDLDRKLDLAELAAGVCRRARRVSGARAAAVAAWEAGAGKGRIVAIDGEIARSLSGARIEGDSSLLGLALNNGTLLPRDDMTGKPKFPLYVQGVDTGAGSAIIVPMIADEHPIGGLVVEYEGPRQYAEADVERLKILAVFVAPAFRNAVLFGEVKALSQTDALTGLPNRRATERALASATVVAERTAGSFALAIADVDHFKKLNDRYGHEAGDRVLQMVARAIRDALRPGDHAGRWGGEEFLIVLPAASLEDAARVIDRIRRGVGQMTLDWEGSALSVTLSAGVTAFPEVIRNGAAAIASADAALYKAKRSGRNSVALAEPKRR